MNTPSPLIPQGTLPSRGKSTFFFKVVMILTVHVVLIGGMLLQGCKDTNKTETTGTTSPDTNTAAAESSNLPPVSPTGMSNAATAPQQTGAQPPQVTQAPLPPVQPPPVTTAPMPLTAPAGTTEYVIASGDTLGAIAHKNGLTVKALTEANPGVNPRKLKVGQKIQIPAGGTAVASAAAPGAAAADVATGDTTIYTVKTGDTLTRIAKLNHTSFKKIMALNDLKTTSIRVGQKLKVPVKAAGTETPSAPVVPATPTAVAPMQPAPAATTTTAATTSSTAAN